MAVDPFESARAVTDIAVDIVHALAIVLARSRFALIDVVIAQPSIKAGGTVAAKLFGARQVHTSGPAIAWIPQALIGRLMTVLTFKSERAVASVTIEQVATCAAIFARRRLALICFQFAQVAIVP